MSTITRRGGELHRLIDSMLIRMWAKSGESFDADTGVSKGMATRNVQREDEQASERERERM